MSESVAPLCRVGLLLITELPCFLKLRELDGNTFLSGSFKWKIFSGGDLSYVLPVKELTPLVNICSLLKPQNDHRGFFLIQKSIKTKNRNSKISETESSGTRDSEAMSGNCLSAAPGKLHRSWCGVSGSRWCPTSNLIHTAHYLLGCVDAQPPRGSYTVQFLASALLSKGYKATLQRVNTFIAFLLAG